QSAPPPEMAPADPTSVRVEIEGLRKELEENVRLHLTLLEIGKGGKQRREEGSQKDADRMTAEEKKAAKREEKAAKAEQKEAAKEERARRERGEQPGEPANQTADAAANEAQREEITGPRLLALHRRA